MTLGAGIPSCLGRLSHDLIMRLGETCISPHRRYYRRKGTPGITDGIVVLLDKEQEGLQWAGMRQ